MSIKKLRDDNEGRLPAYAWPGGYPLFYVTADGGCLCPDCANGPDASEDADDPQWRLVAYDVHWEGPALTCEHCGAEIESAYGSNQREENDDPTA